MTQTTEYTQGAVAALKNVTLMLADIIISLETDGNDVEWDGGYEAGLKAAYGLIRDESIKAERLAADGVRG